MEKSIPYEFTVMRAIESVHVGNIRVIRCEKKTCGSTTDPDTNRGCRIERLVRRRYVKKVLVLSDCHEPDAAKVRVG